MSECQRRILIAGIGNIFQGDDAFGVEVVRKLSARHLPEGVCVKDFGIRGFDVAYALNDGWDLVILLDCIARKNKPGTLSVLEPDRDDLEASFSQTEIQPHGMDPVQALRLAKSMGELPARILVVGCEPADLGGSDGAMGLSPLVEAAVDLAANTAERLALEALSLTAG